MNQGASLHPRQVHVSCARHTTGARLARGGAVNDGRTWGWYVRMDVRVVATAAWQVGRHPEVEGWARYGRCCCTFLFHALGGSSSFKTFVA